jgi:hypothetical protein
MDTLDGLECFSVGVCLSLVCTKKTGKKVIKV